MHSIEEQAADTGNVFAQLGLNTNSFFAQSINFLLAFAILWWLILKPLSKKLEERRKIIDQSLDNAKKVETELRMAEERARTVLDKANVEASLTIQRAITEADHAAEKNKLKAKQDIEKLIAQAKHSIDEDKQTMRQEIRQESATLIIAALERILPEKYDKKTDDAFIRDILKKI